MLTLDDSKASADCAMACAAALLEVFERLWVSESARKVVCFPTGWLGFPSDTQVNLLRVIKAKLCIVDNLKKSSFYKHVNFQPGHPLLCFPDLSCDGWTSVEEWVTALPREKRENGVSALLRVFHEALAAVFAAGVVHTDARLPNVMVRDGPGEEPELVLIDFDEAVFAGDRVPEYLRNAMICHPRYPHGEEFNYAIQEYHAFFEELARIDLRDLLRGLDEKGL